MVLPILGARSAPWISNLVAVSVIAVVLFVTVLGFWAFQPPIPRPGSHGGTTVQVTIPVEPSGPVSIQEVLRLLYAPLKMQPTTPSFTDDLGRSYKLPAKPLFPNLLGKDLLVVDLETRPLDKNGQLLHKGAFRWGDLDYLSGGVMNHYTYAMIHGYDYKFVQAASFDDRHNTWIKPSALANLLKHYKFVVFLDADAAFHQMQMPMEWLLNYWQITPEISLAMPLDPSGPPGTNDDRFNRTLTNTGFIIAQQSERTQEILRAWHECPDDTRYPDCSQWKQPRFHEQSAFGNYIRYDYEENVKELPCTEANGYPSETAQCEGIFMRHYWYGKERVRDDLANSTMEAIMAPIQKLYMDHRKDIITEQAKNEII
ncbi:uncharacterized protein BDZ99DRAFT_525564 [Mytilinidion resinicola]|uniref:Nucleotide-diphospho-sugar transferase domain-containing protein n=1 Tax=Mytilinidion resinicola TaxID=574789 RepID=A0A6A6YA87_9PEZI|nr:uncharacterized protein BDZ99DRAFT_525564 [Mytilinidion resinicola]KAF2804737.1 hypothetical protein BDZ99DRAFT_525564 [Mytilinidion resinicola]